MSVKLEELKVKAYTNYYVDLSAESAELMIDWDSNSPYVRIGNFSRAPFHVAVCHINNLDNLIAGLTLLKEKIKNSKK